MIVGSAGYFGRSTSRESDEVNFNEVSESVMISGYYCPMNLLSRDDAKHNTTRTGGPLGRASKVIGLYLQTRGVTER